MPLILLLVTTVLWSLLLTTIYCWRIPVLIFCSLYSCFVIVIYFYFEYVSWKKLVLVLLLKSWRRPTSLDFLYSCFAVLLLILGICFQTEPCNKVAFSLFLKAYFWLPDGLHSHVHVNLSWAKPFQELATSFIHNPKT